MWVRTMAETSGMVWCLWSIGRNLSLNWKTDRTNLEHLIGKSMNKCILKAASSHFKLDSVNTKRFPSKIIEGHEFSRFQNLHRQWRLKLAAASSGMEAVKKVMSWSEKRKQNWYFHVFSTKQLTSNVPGHCSSGIFKKPGKDSTFLLLLSRLGRHELISRCPLARANATSWRNLAYKKIRAAIFRLPTYVIAAVMKKGACRLQIQRFDSNLVDFIDTCNLICVAPRSGLRDLHFEAHPAMPLSNGFPEVSWPGGILTSIFCSVLRLISFSAGVQEP